MATKKPFPAALFGGKDSKSKDKMPAALAKHAAKPAAEAHAGLKAKKLARGGGIEIKGKTKGKMIAMQKGGTC